MLYTYYFCLLKKSGPSLTIVIDLICTEKCKGETICQHVPHSSPRALEENPWKRLMKASERT